MIIYKTTEEIKTMREGGKILACILDKVAKMVKPGISTGELEAEAVRLITEAGGRPAFKGYKTHQGAEGFPTALCTSVNDEIVHAPSLPSRLLKEGDIIGIDVGMEYPFRKDTKGLYTDMAVTVPVGKIDPRVEELLAVTKNSLKLAINKVKSGNSLNDIGTAVEEYAEKAGFSVVRDLVGHGVGKGVHEDPQVPNYKITDSSIENHILKPGMTIAIEPMVNMGGAEITTGEDGFAFVTEDGGLSAHFEHTVAVTEKGCEILTEL